MHGAPLLMLELVRGGSASPTQTFQASIFLSLQDMEGCRESTLWELPAPQARGQREGRGAGAGELAASSQGQAGSHRPLELSCLFHECQGDGLESPCSSGQVRNIFCCQKDGQKEVAFPFAKCVGNVIYSQEDSAAI